MTSLLSRLKRVDNRQYRKFWPENTHLGKREKVGINIMIRLWEKKVSDNSHLGNE
jgi:hypothetical protein